MILYLFLACVVLVSAAALGQYALRGLRRNWPVVRDDLTAIRAGFVAEHEAIQAAKARQALDAPAELGLETS